MGQQQLLLITLGVILVGIAIGVGISMVNATSIASNKDAIINDLNNLASYAYVHHIRPTTMDGGGGSYTGGSGFKIPTLLRSNVNGTYTAANSTQSVTFVATSAQGYGIITAVCDSTGHLGNFTYSGEFL